VCVGEWGSQTSGRARWIDRQLESEMDRQTGRERARARKIYHACMCAEESARKKRQERKRVCMYEN